MLSELMVVRAELLVVPVLFAVELPLLYFLARAIPLLVDIITAAKLKSFVGGTINCEAPAMHTYW